MRKLVWRVKLVVDFGDRAAETEVEAAWIERDEFTVPETLGLSLGEGKRLTAAIQTEIVRAQAAEQTLRAVIDWGRYAEAFAYDDQTRTFSLENP
ncbi:AAA-associated domain-containing protein [Methylocystis silviterrae]|uniref:AAA-associated domain-containing protein n=1 Tax=Methylocystis silviterrae TaxID=2743612 RepID=UPI001AEE053F|nr:AAA-associated domain-containing protein [Methylocystis silviterrae]